MKVLSLGLTAAALLALGTAASAQILAFDASGTSTNRYGGVGTVGYTFTVNSPITVTELEMMGIRFTNSSIPVGIWDNAGTLLVSANISTTSPAVTTPSASGFNFFGTPVAPLALTPGNYTIGAFGSGNDTVVFGGAIISAPEVTYGSAALISSGSLVRPPAQTPGLAIFGPSFKFQATSAVPEPGAVALMGGMVTLGGLAIRRRARK